MALFLASCEKNNGNELPDDHVIQFEDPNFLKALLVVKETEIYDAETDDYVDYLIDVDANNDGEITIKEAKNVRALELNEYDEEDDKVIGFDIESMPEIKYFTALEYLDCSYNELTSLDVSGCVSLEYLECSDNQLTSLDVSGCAALETLNCNSNELTSLDASGCTALTFLECGVNQLTSLDLSNNTALTRLYCQSNQLTSIDLSNNAALESLFCHNNQLTSLDLSNNTALTELWCDGNQFTKIILSRNHLLEEYTIQGIIEEYGDIIEYVE